MGTDPTIHVHQIRYKKRAAMLLLSCHPPNSNVLLPFTWLLKQTNFILV